MVRFGASGHRTLALRLFCFPVVDGDCSTANGSTSFALKLFNPAAARDYHPLLLLVVLSARHHYRDCW